MTDSINYYISTDRSKLDLRFIHEFLNKAYWCEGVPVEIVKKSIENSLCFGVYDHGKQIGFARVVTDYCTFGYLADVFIIEEYRGKGLSKDLMKHIKEHPDLQGFRNFVLATIDAHGLYEQFGFEPVKNPERLMAISRPGLYTKAKK
jgi:GNAT superfamily N-acetyltransferase